jgi:hypothetical protein
MSMSLFDQVHQRKMRKLGRRLERLQNGSYRSAGIRAKKKARRGAMDLLADMSGEGARRHDKEWLSVLETAERIAERNLDRPSACKGAKPTAKRQRRKG